MDLVSFNLNTFIHYFVLKIINFNILTHFEICIQLFWSLKLNKKNKKMINFCRKITFNYKNYIQYLVNFGINYCLFKIEFK